TQVRSQAPQLPGSTSRFAHWRPHTFCAPQSGGGAGARSGTGPAPPSPGSVVRVAAHPAKSPIDKNSSGARNTESDQHAVERARGLGAVEAEAVEVEPKRAQHRELRLAEVAAGFAHVEVLIELAARVAGDHHRQLLHAVLPSFA